MVWGSLGGLLSALSPEVIQIRSGHVLYWCGEKSSPSLSDFKAQMMEAVWMAKHQCVLQCTCIQQNLTQGQK